MEGRTGCGPRGTPGAARPAGLGQGARVVASDRSGVTRSRARGRVGRRGEACGCVIHGAGPLLDGADPAGAPGALAALPTAGPLPDGIGPSLFTSRGLKIRLWTTESAGQWHCQRQGRGSATSGSPGMSVGQSGVSRMVGTWHMSGVAGEPVQVSGSRWCPKVGHL